MNIRTLVKAGKGRTTNHNETLAVRTALKLASAARTRVLEAGLF